MEEHVVGDILVDYSASEGLHSIYVKCTCFRFHSNVVYI